MKVKELVEMLSKLDQNVDVVIASCPDVNGWVADPLPFVGVVDGALLNMDYRLQGAIVIAPRDEARGEEQDIDWPERPI